MVDPFVAIQKNWLDMNRDVNDVDTYLTHQQQLEISVLHWA